MPVKVHALDHLVINVTDVARTTAWYQSILGMEVVVFEDTGELLPSGVAVGPHGRVPLLAA